MQDRAVSRPLGASACSGSDFAAQGSQRHAGGQGGDASPHLDALHKAITKWMDALQAHGYHAVPLDDGRTAVTFLRGDVCVGAIAFDAEGTVAP